MPKKIDPVLRDRVVRLVREHRSEYPSLTAALDGIAPSIGSVGDAFDNALMETINGLYQAECIRTTGLPRRPLPDDRRRRVRDRRLGRRVQHS